MAMSAPECTPSPQEEASFLVYFDRDGALRAYLSHEPKGPTPYILIHAIPLSVTLSEILRALHSSGDDASPPAERGARARSPPCGDCPIRAARVGFVRAEGARYGVLVQCASAAAAAAAVGRWRRRPGAAVAFLRPTATRPGSGEGGRERGAEKEGERGAEKERERGAEKEGERERGAEKERERGAEKEGEGEGRVSLEALCRLSGSPHGSARDRARPSRVAPKEGFCSICQEHTASSQSCVVTLCQHIFHVDCLRQHRVTQCPVCRFSMESLKSKSKSKPKCHACGTYHDLWTCLVCGCVSCGAGKSSDHKRHFEYTGHSCAMENDTSRIWNHAKKMFLHHDLAIELGREDDAKAARDAAADGLQNHKFGSDGATASTYRRSRWWWSEKDEDAAQELNREYVERYYLDALDDLIEEQRVYYEHCRAAAVKLEISRSLSATLRQLLDTEQKRRRHIVVAYMDKLRRLALQEKNAFKCFVRHQVLRNEELCEELMLQSHAIRNRTERISEVIGNIERAKGRGAKQLALREAELIELEEKLAKAMLTIE